MSNGSKQTSRTSSPDVRHLDWTSTGLTLPDLPHAAWNLIRQVPAGRVTTYGDLARGLGDDRARAARWLGELLNHHRHDADCRCYRVVRSSGEVGLFVSGDPVEKAALLRAEGIDVTSTGMVDLSKRFVEFTGERPLQELKDEQQRLSREVIEQSPSERPRTWGAVDVAYRADGTAYGVYVQVEAASLKVIGQLSLTRPAPFPYIPGYLTWRELPVMLELSRLAKEQGILGDVLFCDGNGRLHPWRAGIAVCLGVVLDHPVIGVGKSLLCGQVNVKEMADGEFRPVMENGEEIGRAIRRTTGSKPIYVSVGNRIDLQTATESAQAAMTTHRLPEPIHIADRLTKSGKRSL